MTHAAYPLPDRPLRAAWSDRRSQGLAFVSVAAAVAAIWLRSPVDLAGLDDVVLRVLFPACLAFVLAFAPAPATHVGRIARVLTVLGLAASVFAGDYLPVMLACYPVVLMLSVLLGRERDVLSGPDAAP